MMRMMRMMLMMHTEVSELTTDGITINGWRESRRRGGVMGS